MGDREKLPEEIQEQVAVWAREAVEWSFSRRSLVTKGTAGAAGVMVTSLVGSSLITSCKAVRPEEESDVLALGFGQVRLEYKQWNKSGNYFDIAVINVVGEKINYDYNKIILQELKTNLDPTDADFRYQVIAHLSATASLIKYYFENDPYGKLFKQLFENQENESIFMPEWGPAIVFRHPDVIDVLSRPDRFTVDPYNKNMSISTSGHSKHGAEPPPDRRDEDVEKRADLDDYHPRWVPAKGVIPAGNKKGGYYNHYMLGTDHNDLYIPDARICRYVIENPYYKNTRTTNPRSRDAGLRDKIRQVCNDVVGATNIRPGETFDIIQTIGRNVPVGVIMEFLGFPSYAKGKSGSGVWEIKQDGVRLRGGDAFKVPESITSRFHFEFLEKRRGSLMGLVPTQDQAYAWVRDNFRMIFNNFGGDPKFQRDGEIANEYLLSWSAYVIDYQSHLIDQGKKVPDTMITRLIKLQRVALKDAASRRKYAELFGCSEEDLAVRLADDRIQINAFGAFVGAVANPEEANGRVIEGMFKLKYGEYKLKNGSYADLKKAAESNNMTKINKYVIEILRLNPQGEVLLRKCIKKTTLRGEWAAEPGDAPGNEAIEGAVPIPKNMLVFVAIGAAMQDPRLGDADKFDINRSDRTEQYNHKSGDGLYQSDPRRNEDAQSLVYLHHGFGRHKCLGRYASEMTMEEVLRAVVLLGDLERVDKQMIMDKDGLYSKQFRVRLKSMQSAEN